MNKSKKLYLAIVFLLIFGSSAFADSNLGSRLVRSARAELGNGETTSNNCGVAIKRYLNGRENLAWCAGFISYILQQNNVKDIAYCLSAKTIFNRAKAQGLIVSTPRPGDLICFWRGKRNGWQGHIGIVESVSKAAITAIEGNAGAYPSKVKRVTYKRNNIPRLLGFVRVEE
ncbi:MAG TPA: CHAP domain-containing protein [Candidatus Omnitrophica bacterium]|nr:CHAP domain-containing protein [Candidatus Omnitrophota bacterium]